MAKPPSHVLITGGSGFLGVSVAELLLKQDPQTRIILTDITEHPRLASLKGKVEFIKADLGDATVSLSLLNPSIDTVYHFASLVSYGAEQDFEAGLRVNVHATMHLLEACRALGRKPRFIFTSSIATFGGNRLPREVDDWTHQHPQNSYGIAKALGEQLLNDYSRKGYIDGRGVRLPAVIVRDEPNTAASGYASALVREPLAGRDFTCPVSLETRIPLIGVRKCVELMVQLADVEEGALGDYRTVNGPGISPSAGEIIEAVATIGYNTGRTELGRVSFEPSPAIQNMISTWPETMTASRAREIELRGDESIDAIIREYLETLD